MLALTPAWPRNLRTTCPDATSHSTTALSPPPEQRLLLSKELESRAGKISVPLTPASAPRSHSGPRLTLPRPAPRSRGRCTSAVASLAAGSTASGSCRCRKSDSNCHPLGNTTRGLLGRRLQEAEVGPGMTIRALTIINRTARTALCPQSNVFNSFRGSSGARGFGSGKAIAPPSLPHHRTVACTGAFCPGNPRFGVTLLLSSIVYFLFLTSGFNV